MATLVNKFNETVEVPETEKARALASGFTEPINVGLNVQKPSTITPESLAPVPRYTLPSGEPGTQTDADRMFASIQAGVKAQAEQRAAELAASPPPTALDTQLQELLGSQVKSAQEAQTLPAQQLALEQTGGIPQLSQQKAQIDTQIAQKIAEGQALDVSFQQANERAKQGVFDPRIIQGKQQQNYRQYTLAKNALAAEAGILQSVSLGLTGQIQAAQATADRAIDLKFKALELEQNTKQAQLNALKPLLDAQEKRRADELQARYDREKQDILDKKEKEKAIQSAMMAYFNAGGTDTKVANAISRASTVEEAQRLAGIQVGTAVSEERALDTAYKRAQIANIQSEIRNRGASSAGYDPAEILAYAQEKASTGKTPTGVPKGSFGLIDQIAKELPKPDGTLVDRNTGVKSSALSPTQEDGILALYDITKKVKELAELDKQRIRGLTPAFLGKVFGSEDQQRYVDLRDEIVDLLARARTGAALTTQEEKFYKDQLPGRIARVGFVFGVNSQSRIENFDKKINGTLNTRLQGQGASIYGYSKVKVGDQEYKVGDIISNGEQQARVNPDGSLTYIQ